MRGVEALVKPGTHRYGAKPHLEGSGSAFWHSFGDHPDPETHADARSGSAP